MPPLPPLPPLPGGLPAPLETAVGGDDRDTTAVSETDEDIQRVESDEESEAEEELEAAALPEEEEDEVGEAAKSIAAALKPLPRWAIGAARSQQNEPSATPAPMLPGKAAGRVAAARQQLPAAVRGKQPVAAAAKGQRGAKSKTTQPGRQPRHPKQQGKEQPGQRRRKTKAELAAEAHEAALAAEEAEAAAAAAAAAAQTISKVEAVRAALEANRQLQSRLRRLLASTDRAIDRNAALQQQVRARLAAQVPCPMLAAAGMQIDRANTESPSSCLPGGVLAATRSPMPASLPAD